MERLSFLVPVTPPFNLEYTIRVLRRSNKNEIDTWTHDRYSRILMLDGDPHFAIVRQPATRHTSYLEVTVEAARMATGAQKQITTLITRMLGLNIDLKPFYRHIRNDTAMHALTAQFIGMRPPKLASGHETLIAAIACQQLSLTVGITLLNRLSQCFGHTIGARHARRYTFPTPDGLADSTPSQLMKLGFSRQKAQSVIQVSREIADGTLCLDKFDNWDDAHVRQRLLMIKGIGGWTADYFLLRSMGRLNVFPRNDSGALNGLASWLKLEHKPNSIQLEHILAPRQPYAGLIYFHLLLRKLS